MVNRVLIVEDQPDLAEGLKTNLQIEGYEVTICGDGDRALQAVADFQPNLVVLDMMLPGRDGFDILSRLRRRGEQCLVLCLTARGEEVDKVRALRSGADDYVTKPFGLMELLARIEAMLRRRHSAASEGAVAFGQVSICRQTRDVRRQGCSVELTPKEYDLLLALLDSQGAVMSRQQLMKMVWGHSGSVISRTVDTHIGELRRKLETDPANPEHLLTVRKAGYRLQS